MSALSNCDIELEQKILLSLETVSYSIEMRLEFGDLKTTCFRLKRFSFRIQQNLVLILIILREHGSE